MKKTSLALDELLNLLPDAVVIVDSTGNIAFANNSVRGLLGYGPDELVGRPLDCLIPESERSDHRSHFADFHAHGEQIVMGDRPLVRGLDKAGAEVPVSISIANIDLDGERYSIAVMRDSGELHSEITQITFQAETDPLTGLANRLGLSQALQSAIEKSSPFGLLYMDLEKFKPINDAYGHAVGDEVLKIVAQRLQASIRSCDLAARVGGDEFVLLLDGLADSTALEQRAAVVAESIKRPMHLGDIADAVGVNIGSAQFPRDGQTERELLQVADENMYRAKQRGVVYRMAN
ncbi:MAG: sensor domain-containing diguanylate cyclase [Gammaproteobacteria bacterium]|nr:sensor domain-containing diguanylate cyclase [Gammaproteobacteria bacterium]